MPAREWSDGVGLDVSEVMLDAAGARFEGEEQIELVEHDLVDARPELGRFFAVVSSMAIHHLEHDRKRNLCTATGNGWRWQLLIGVRPPAS